MINTLLIILLILFLHIFISLVYNKLSLNSFKTVIWVSCKKYGWSLVRFNNATIILQLIDSNSLFSENSFTIFIAEWTNDFIEKVRFDEYTNISLGYVLF